VTAYFIIAAFYVGLVLGFLAAIGCDFFAKRAADRKVPL
jgi:hypothetical protein